MNNTPDQDAGQPAPQVGGKATAQKVRENRRKAALKANMARRKAQARAKAAAGDTATLTNQETE